MGKLRGSVTLMAVLVTLTGCTPMDNVLSGIFGRSMRDQRSFDPYENPRPAPENSVAFAAGNYAAVPGDVNLGQPEGALDVPPPFTQLDVLTQQPVVVNLSNPVEADGESLVRGEELYLRYCAVCHGPDGAGTNCYIAEAGFPCVFPLNSGAPLTYTDGYIYGMIRVGRGIMPSYGHAITHYDRWNVVNYIRSLQAAAGGGAPATGNTATGGE